MSGHSKWSTIKHKKGAADAKRGKIFSRLAKELTVSARLNGGDPAANITLRTILAKCKAANMPSDNIERAIKKGTGDLQGAAIEEILFESYAPGGVGLIIQCLSDNRNRSVADVRHVLQRHNATLAGSNQVLRNFQRRGQISGGEGQGAGELRVGTVHGDADGAAHRQGRDVQTEALALEADAVGVVHRCLPEGSKRPRVCGSRFHNGRSLSPWWICHSGMSTPWKVPNMADRPSEAPARPHEATAARPLEATAARPLNATAASLLGFLHEGPKTGWDLVVTAQERIGKFCCTSLRSPPPKGGLARITSMRSLS